MRVEDCLVVQTVESSKLRNGSASKTALLVQAEPQQKFTLSGTPSPVTPLAHCRYAGSRSDALACTRALATFAPTGTRESSVTCRGLSPRCRTTHSSRARRPPHIDSTSTSFSTGPFLPFSDEDCCAMLPAVEMSRDACTTSHTLRRTLREVSH